MHYLTILFILIFFSVIFVVNLYSHNKVINEIKKIDTLQDKLIYKKENVKCDTMTYGGKKSIFMYKNADLFFMNDAFIVAGFFVFLKRKIYKSLFIATKNIKYYKLN